MRTSNNSGFTIVELVLVTVIVGLLSAMASQAFTLMKERAYYVSSERVMQDARTALEAGTLHEGDFSGMQTISQNSSGLVTVGLGQTLVPGLVLPEFTNFLVQHDPDCQNGACLASFISVRNCKSQRYTYWFRLGNGGESLLQSVSAPASC